MSIVHKTRPRRAEVTPLEPWQEAYLMSDGTRPGPDEYKQQTGDNWLNLYFLLPLMDGKRPPHLQQREAPWELWKKHGGAYLKQFARQHPGCRPLPWWQWEAPGAADPDMDLEKYVKAIKQAQNRAGWSAEKQRAFLEKHNLLLKGE